MSRFKKQIAPDVLHQASDLVGQRMLTEYGSVFTARGEAVPPDRLIFKDHHDVERFQSSVSTDRIDFGDISIELQSAAATALRRAMADAHARGLKITPRSADSGRRSYADTVALWKSRVEPALEHWLTLGKVTPEQVEHIRSLSPFEQVPEVLTLEEHGIYFSKDLSKTILYSVAPPGTSQHLSMLAFDVAEFNDPRIRQILEDHCWFQTVPSDLPHFTFLGVSKQELPGIGLRCVVYSERDFWVPDI
jgi:hypothetical protein